MLATYMRCMCNNNMEIMIAIIIGFPIFTHWIVIYPVDIAI